MWKSVEELTQMKNNLNETMRSLAFYIDSQLYGVKEEGTGTNSQETFQLKLLLKRYNRVDMELANLINSLKEG